jgi:fatty-acyl-CoA synthase
MMMLAARLPQSGAHWIDHVARHAHATPDAVAIRFGDESISWAALHDRVHRLAAAFAARGVRRSDRVVILMTNRPEFVEVTLAANAAG